MGFHRTRQPQALSREEIAAEARKLYAANEAFLNGMAEAAAFETRTIDPFLIDHGCINPSGHEPIASCGEIVCGHCAKVFWR